MECNWTSSCRLAFTATILLPCHIKDVGSKGRMRHYERWLLYGREQYLNRMSVPEWVSTVIQVADIFTKPLDPTTFRKFRAALLNIRGAEHMPNELLTLLGY